MILVSSFALLGLFLAALGIYGVISYSVTQRTQEIGIRMALGATLARVQLDVIRSTLQLAAIGIAVGAIVSIATSRLIASLLFGTNPGRPHHLPRHGSNPRHNRPPGGLHPSPQSLPHQPHGRPPQQLTRQGIATRNYLHIRTTLRPRFCT